MAHQGPLFRFIDFPGVRLLESEQMIRDKFRSSISADEGDRIDEVSRAIFGIAASDAEFKWPEQVAEDLWGDGGGESDSDVAADEEPEDLECDAPENDDTEASDDAFDRARAEYALHQQRFQYRYLQNDQERIDFLKSLGFDFTDDAGYLLRIASLFSRQAEAAANGWAGHMPDRSELATREWGSRLEEAAQKFKRAKR